MTLEEFQTYLKRPATMEEAGEIVDILGSTILSAVKMLPNTEENKEVSPLQGGPAPARSSWICGVA